MKTNRVLVVALCLTAAFGGSASSQSMMDPAATPGGTEGRAGPANEREAIRSGDAIPAPSSIGIPAEPAPPQPKKEEPHPMKKHEK